MLKMFFYPHLALDGLDIDKTPIFVYFGVIVHLTEDEVRFRRQFG